MGGIRLTLDIALENYIDIDKNYYVVKRKSIILIDKAVGKYLRISENFYP